MSDISSRSDISSKLGEVIVRLLGSGAIGVGLVLVVLPAGLLFLGAKVLSSHQIVGLPLLAIFGIMILFGSLALVAMLFKNLKLTDKRQPLALPEGSIRAAIALSLIVLFAIISIMLFHTSPGSQFQVSGLNEMQRNELLLKAPDRVIAVATVACAASAPSAPASGASAAATAAPEAAACFSVTLLSPMPAPMVDVAKQLLILVGTLMTSVTSYYFATRSLNTREGEDRAGPEPKPPEPSPAPQPEPQTSTSASASATPDPGDDGESHVDGCDVAITDPTPDHELPPARGGVEAPRS